MTQKKIELGDFQTPIELTEKVIKRLKDSGVNTPTIIEPTCGEGSFVITAKKYFPNSKIVGLEINKEYVDNLNKKLNQLDISENIDVIHQDFFTIDWKTFLSNHKEPILFLGNPPWVTNSKLGELNSSNLPIKTNFQNHSGIAAITGKSNFDISEWMLLKMIEVMHGRDGQIAMLVKTSVARKILENVWNNNISSLSDFQIIKFDSKKYFNISADACLFTCKLHHKSITSEKTCKIYESFESNNYTLVGISNNRLVNDIDAYKTFSKFFEDNVFKSQHVWRTGVKHDLSPILEIEKSESGYINGLGEVVDVEENFIYPMMKSSDVSNGRHIRKYLVVPQKSTSDDTSVLEYKAPKLWKYLNEHESYFAKRKSSIYKKKSKFAIFGIGDYTFADWKIAISGLYKNLNFILVDSFNDKPILFDDTVNFLSFSSQDRAIQAFEALNRKETLAFLNSLIFWDAKRPITTSVLNHLNIENVVSYYEQRNYSG